MGPPALRRVAVFDADLPPSVAFVRSLGRAGVPVTVFSERARPVASFSRFASGRRRAPHMEQTDDLVDFLVEGIKDGEIDLVAPTSDSVVFSVAAAHERLGIDPMGHPTADAVRACLFKDWFARAMADAGFPTPPSATPLSVEEALSAADALGYPVVVKPRTHVAIGLGPRGAVAADPGELAQLFVPYIPAAAHSIAADHNADLSQPIVQRYYRPDEVDVVSISGLLGDDGDLLSVGHCRKVTAWPPALGIGTRFEAIDDQPFTAAAIAAVRAVLGVGMFELEVLRHRPTGAVWPIDLNPRGYGQITLEIARGNDLPAMWYELVTGRRLTAKPVRRDLPRLWQLGAAYYPAALVRAVAGPRRRQLLADVVSCWRQPRVGAVLDWGDPGPGLAHAVAMFRHPGALVRPHVRDLALRRRSP